MNDMIPISLIPIGIVVVIAVIAAILGALRGFSKSGLRFIGILGSAVASVATCLIIKEFFLEPDTLINFIREVLVWIEQWIGADMVTMINDVLGYVAVSPTMIEFAIQLTAALVLPVLCFVLFVVFSLICWVIYLLITVALSKALKATDKMIPASRLIGLVIGFVSGLIVAVLLLFPVSAYLGLVDSAVESLEQQDAVEEIIPDVPEVDMIKGIVSELNDSPAFVVYRSVGGGLLTDVFMTMHVADTDVKLEDEIDTYLVLAGLVMDMLETESLTEYGTREADIMRQLGVHFGDSKILTPVAGDVLYGVTDAWLNGEAFLGKEKPDLGENSALFDPFLQTLMEIIHGDAHQNEQLNADVITLTEMGAIMTEAGVLANLENTDELMSTLSGSGVIKQLITVLGTNNSMKRLIPEVTNLGVRAIGQTLNIPENVEAVYGQFMDEVASSLNEIKQLPEDQQVEALSGKLDTAFDNAGIAIDEEVLDFYAASMVHDLITNNPNEEVTDADVQAFFLLYAENVMDENDITIPDDSGDNGSLAAMGRPSFDLLNNGNADEKAVDPFAGTVYASMTKEQRKKTGAAALAVVVKELVAMDAESESYTEEAKIVVAQAFTQVLGEDSVLLQTVVAVEITKPVTQKSIENTAGMKSPEAMKVVTVVVTVEDMLVDSKAAAENITPETIEAEAEAIEAIFQTAGTLLETLNKKDENGESEKLDIGTLATSLGTILDSLSTTQSFGQEKTANLFTAVLQSETVRNAADLDMTTATQIADQANQGGGSYSETMGTVAGGVGLAEKLNKGEKITDEELVEIIRTLTPQTAGIIRVYVDANRLESYGVPNKYSVTSADLLDAMFYYLSENKNGDFESEAKALNLMLSMAMSAKDSDSKKIFSSAEGAEDGRLPTAKETVDTVMNSEAVKYSLIDVLTKNGKVTKFDPFGVGEKLEGKEDNLEYVECQTAILEHRAAHPENDDLVYEALAALFGVNVELN